MNRFGFVRVSCVSPRLVVGDPRANGDEIIARLEECAESDIVLFPELGVTGYTCADLFLQNALIDAAIQSVERIARATQGRRHLVVVGAPLAVGNATYNTAIALQDGKALGIVPKQFLANYKEYYEARWFQPARGDEPPTIDLGTLGEVPFGIDLLFEAPGGVCIGIEICEDLWVPIPPSSHQALAGANILLNLSASNETIGKASYRTQLVTGHSGRCIAACAYASAGASESTTDLVFSGHCLIAENGQLLAESERVGDGRLRPGSSHHISSDVDVQKLLHDRRFTTSLHAGSRGGPSYRRVGFTLGETSPAGLLRDVDGQPFVPLESRELDHRCAEIFGIQCAGLAKRLEQLPASMPLNIGISGGLDSTLALVVAVKTCDLLERDRSAVHGLTMPGFGTTSRSLTNATDLMRHLGVTAETIDIRELSLQAYQQIGHRPFGIDPTELDLGSFREALSSVPHERRQDLVFENVQARLRTFLLMSRGFVVGTGDLSEMALGWSTYNGDHMSMYNPNCSIPKTLVKFLVEYVAKREFEAGPVRETLLSIAQSLISPELLPTDDEGLNGQSTEDTLGPYELHDFFLFNTIRCGFSPRKIVFLSEHARFSRKYPREVLLRTLRTFYSRFFSQQFKRSCMPDGPKVGSVSLSPRGDWRMPSDASAAAWLQELDELSHE